MTRRGGRSEDADGSDMLLEMSSPSPFYLLMRGRACDVYLFDVIVDETVHRPPPRGRAAMDENLERGSPPDGVIMSYFYQLTLLIRM